MYYDEDVHLEIVEREVQWSRSTIP
jgi:hypothetical protein